MASGRKTKHARKESRKRNWKTLSFQDEDIFKFKEEGLISFEELTDYQLPVHAESGISNIEPKKAKKRKTVNDVGDSVTKTEESSGKSKKKKVSRNRRKKKAAGSKNDSKIDDSLIDTSPLETNEEGKIASSHVQSKTLKGHNMVEQDLTENSKADESAEFKCDMSDWQGLGVPHPILAAMSEQGFTQPTPIQRETLPLAIFQHQDIIGAAQTGSGKTLAFALPLLTHIIDYKNKRAEKEGRDKKNEDVDEKPLYALILTPTRELALQIYNIMKVLTKYVPVYCAAIVGGLAVQKQERILKKCPEVIIGTPGRLLNIMDDGDTYLQNITQIKFLVIDEVDRMLEFGHFKEASEILRRLSLGKSKWQTFFFSATLTVPQYHKKWSAKYKVESGEESVQKLVDKAHISPKAKIIDLTKKHVAAEQIKQRRVVCTEEEKNLYLLYIILCNSGRTLVFVNSINCTRKITNFLKILGRKPLQLHAGKQQKQRLKALDRFVSNEDSILVATDVAARGLDVPNIDTIIHYHLPKDPKIYIHRSGRTARARNVGQSIILEGPGDFKEYKKIYELMKLGKDLPSLEVDVRLLPDLRKRVALAKKIEKEEHQLRKISAEDNWFEKTAKSLDLEIDDDQIAPQHSNKKKLNAMQALKKELEQLLRQPLVPTGFSGSYITKSGQLETLKF